MSVLLGLCAVLLGIVSLGSPASCGTPKKGSTFCNPMDVDYRFSIENVGYREAADPVVVYFKGDYYLFASKYGGLLVFQRLSELDVC